jgi:hypothetical protein
VNVSDKLETDEFWRTFIHSVGLSSNNGWFERTVYTVKIDGERLGTDASRAAALRAASRLPDLVDLRITNLADIDHALAALRECTDLRHIVFSKTGVTDAGLRHLQYCKRLQSVELGECPVTDDGIRFICSLPSMRGVSGGRCLSETTLDRLAYASPDGPTPQVGRPLRISGRLRLTPPMPVATATLRFFVINEGAPQPGPQQATAAVTLDAANHGTFSVTAKNAGSEWRPGRNVMYVTVMVLSTPAIQFHFEQVLPDVKPESP